MTEKDLSKLNRTELLGLFLEQCERNNALEQELSDMKAELNRINDRISNAESLAKAFLTLTNNIEEAQEEPAEKAEVQEEPKLQEEIVIEDIDLSDMVEVSAAAKTIDPNKREEDVETWIRNHQVPEKYQIRGEFAEDENGDDELEDDKYEVLEYNDNEAEAFESKEYDNNEAEANEAAMYEENSEDENNDNIDEDSSDDLADEDINVEEIAYEKNEGVMRPIIPTSEAVTIKVRQTPIRQLSPSRVKRSYSAVGFRKPKTVKPMLSKNVRNAVK